MMFSGVPTFSDSFIHSCGCKVSLGDRNDALVLKTELSIDIPNRGRRNKMYRFPSLLRLSLKSRSLHWGSWNLEKAKKSALVL